VTTPASPSRTNANPKVAILMGSQSDWEVMSNASKQLDDLGIVHEVRVLSAHRTPHAAAEYTEHLSERGVQVVIAAAGGAAHLAGVVAAHTSLPVLGVPMQSPALGGLDSLLSTVQMPAGIPGATFAIGKPGAVNAALFAAAIIAHKDERVATAWKDFRAAQTAKVLSIGDPRG
jgi:5-(carboxyamino)imidazole ribonucleotide mutase